MQRIHPFPGYHPRWSFRQTYSASRPSHFRRIHLNCSMNMQLW